MFQIFLSIVICSSAGQPAVLSESVFPYTNDFAVTVEGDAIYISGDGELFRVDPDNPQAAAELEVDWNGQLGNWEGPGALFNLCGSPDGELICFTARVMVPESFLADSNEYIPSPLLVVLCRPDGSEPEVLGLTFDAGGGPAFAFTTDSRFVYGSPWLECQPTPESYVRYIRGNGENLLEPWLRVNVATGERSGDPNVLGDGFTSNPYSDLVATGAYPPNRIADVVSGETLLESTGVQAGSIIETWVLPGAGLARDSLDRQVLRRSDGTESVNPGEPYEVYCRLPDGRYLFSRDAGQTVMAGTINWDDFTPSGAVELPSLSGMLDTYTCIKPLPSQDTGDEETGVAFRSGVSLYHCAVPAADG